jgi:ATP-dependent Clp protease protease subunit
MRAGGGEQDAVVARMYERRILFLRGALDDGRADETAAALIALDAGGAGEITLYVDSPGGESSAMFTLHDTMGMLRSPVATCCVGQAAGEAAFVLATGTGRRSATRNARILLRQPVGGRDGSASDIERLARELDVARDRFEQILSVRTGKPRERIREDSDHGLWLSSTDARDYGLIDEVVEGRGEQRRDRG